MFGLGWLIDDSSPSMIGDYSKWLLLISCIIDILYCKYLWSSRTVTGADQATVL